MSEETKKVLEGLRELAQMNSGSSSRIAGAVKDPIKVSVHVGAVTAYQCIITEITQLLKTT